jgi:hypothetical protein
MNLLKDLVFDKKHVKVWNELCKCGHLNGCQFEINIIKKGKI